MTDAGVRITRVPDLARIGMRSKFMKLADGMTAALKLGCSAPPCLTVPMTRLQVGLGLARISHTAEFFRRRERILAATPLQA
jgi:hypothetical protein